MKASVSLCMIVRNEQNNLGQCLESVQGLFHEIIVVDTGSTDGTKAVAERFGAKVFDFAWVEDFAAARNESRRHATGQWIFWLDADDRLDAENRKRLEHVFEQLDSHADRHNPVLMISCVSDTLPGEPPFMMSQARLFQNNGNLLWTRRVHEHLTCAQEGDQITVRGTDVVVRHEGYQNPEQRARKQFRDQRLLEREYLINPDDPMTLFYLSRIHLGRGNAAEAMRLARRSIAADRGGNSFSTPTAWVVVIESLLLLGRQAEAMAACNEALASYPGNPSLLYRRGCVLFDLGRTSEAEICLRQLLGGPQEGLSIAGHPIGINGELTRMVLGRVYVKQRRWVEADAEFRRVLEAQPTNIPAWVLLGAVNVVMGRRHEVLELIGGLEQYPNTEMERAVMRAQLHLADNQSDEALRWARAAIASRPAAVEGWIILSDVLFHVGTDAQACVHAHQKVLTIDPKQAEIRHRLEQMLAVRPNLHVAQGSLLGAGQNTINSGLSVA